MALEKIVSNLILDVYDHDTTPTTIKSIACDDETRYAFAELNYRGVPYYITSNAKVTLTVLRPDGAGVSIDGRPEGFTVTEDGGDVTKYGPYAELDAAAICVSGTLLAQFKIEDGQQILRTEIFRIKNGRALDAEISDWAGKYQGYDLDDLVKKVDAIGMGAVRIDGDVLAITTLDSTVEAYHAYVDQKVAGLVIPVVTADTAIHIDDGR